MRNEQSNFFMGNECPQNIRDRLEEHFWVKKKTI